MGFIIENGASLQTGISNCFIEEYMPSANGEFVKVYIYLMKCAGSVDAGASICTIADVLDMTEKDVVRALKYWEKVGLLNLTFNEDKKLTSLSINECKPLRQLSKPAEHEGVTAIAAKVIPEVTAEDVALLDAPVKKTYTNAELDSFLEDVEVKQLFHIAEKYLGRSLSKTDSNTLLYIYDDLKMAPDVIEYLIEYCVSLDHKSIQYIESVAIAWTSQGITNVKDAKAHNRVYKKYGSPIMKAFGLVGRVPAQSEMNYIVKWTNSYGFTIELILEACNKTIEATHSPNFAYADKILSNWKDNGVSTIDDVKKLDEAFMANKTSKKATSAKKVNVNNEFNNFPQREYDFEALEKALLK